MTLIWTSTGLVFSNLIKPPKLRKFLKIFTNTYSLATLKKFQAINTNLRSILKVKVPTINFVAIKFVDPLLVVLDTNLKAQILNKAGDVTYATLICAMHA